MDFKIKKKSTIPKLPCTRSMTSRDVLKTPFSLFSHSRLCIMDVLSEANGSFAFCLLKILGQDNPSHNVFYSPVSISSALAMVFLGAKGNTAAQMAQVRLPVAQEKGLALWLCSVPQLHVFCSKATSKEDGGLEPGVFTRTCSFQGSETAWGTRCKGQGRESPSPGLFGKTFSK